MSTFTFSPADSLDLSTGVYYVHIVTAEPSQAATTVSQLTISDAINYVPYTLSGLTYTTTKWTFNNFTFPFYTFNTVPLGIVICKKLGVSFNNSDPVIYYADFYNTLNQVIALTTGKYNLTVSFPVKGVIIYQPYYNYSVGPYVATETIPKGLLYLLGTRNNTQSWKSITDNAILPMVTASTNLFNRDLDALSQNQLKWAFSFGSRRIKIGTCVVWSRDTVGGVWYLYGSNNYIYGTSIDVTSDWDLLGSSSPPTYAGPNFITANSNTYYKYFKLVSSDTANSVLQEIEFYNSSMYSIDEDLMSTVIDSSFETDLLDNSGWDHTWTNIGTPSIQNNSLYLNGSSGTYLAPSTLFNLSDRNFKLSIDFKWINQTTSGNPAILNWDGSDRPLVYSIYNGDYLHSIGTDSVWFYLPNTSIGQIGIPTETNYDTLKTTRVGSLFTTYVNNSVSNSVYSGSSASSVGNATFVQLGINYGNEYIKGYIRNFKLIT